MSPDFSIQKSGPGPLCRFSMVHAFPEPNRGVWSESDTTQCCRTNAVWVLAQSTIRRRSTRATVSAIEPATTTTRGSEETYRPGVGGRYHDSG